MKDLATRMEDSGLRGAHGGLAPGGLQQARGHGGCQQPLGLGGGGEGVPRATNDSEGGGGASGVREDNGTEDAEQDVICEEGPIPIVLWFELLLVGCGSDGFAHSHGEERKETSLFYFFFFFEDYLFYFEIRKNDS